MAQSHIPSLNCHGFNMGTLCYLQDKCVSFDIVLLQETWLSNENSGRLDDIPPNFVVMHSSAGIIWLVDLMGERQFCTVSTYLVWLQELKLIIVGVLLLNYHLTLALTWLFTVYTCLFLLAV